MIGEVAWQIVHLAEDLGVGLIVLGSRGRGDKEGYDGQRL